MESDSPSPGASFRRLRELFDRLSDLPEEEREPEIERSATDDPTLAADLRSMLAAAQRAGTLLDTPAARLTEGDERLPQVPGFRLRRRIGRGGSSTVYLAAQEGAGFTRDVALKLVDKVVDPAALRRVREEQRILARLEHPGIARLYDAGLTGAGQPFLAMERVEGKSIVEHCRSRQLPLRERLDLFLEVLDAVGYAHGEAVVHRDLKPANILVSERGEAKLLDFGIAKLAADPGDEDETLTLRRAMTPAYASPEQVRGERVTASSDIYSLGVVLYELLAECLPYRLDGKRFETYQDAIRGQDPEPPSVAFARTAGSTTGSTTARERVELGRTRRALRGDLDAVLLKALRKEPEARYASVSELAEDLRRFLAGRPVSALRGSFRYRARKFLRRHRGAALASGAAAVAVIALAAFPAFRARLLGEERGGARAEELAGFYAARPADAEAARLLRDGADRLAGFDPREARDLFRQAARRAPGLALAWDGLARAEGELGEVGKAAAAARRAGSAGATRDLPGNALPPEEKERLRARALAAERRWKEAIPAAEGVFGRLPGRLDAGLDLVAALFHAGRTDEAATTLGRLRQLPSRGGGATPDPRLDLAEAEVVLRLGEYQRAAALANRVRDGSGEAAALPFRLRAERLHGEALARLDQRAAAGRELESVAARAQAAGLGAEAASARLAVGIVLLRTAGNAQARAMLESARDGLRAAGDRGGELAARGHLAVLAGKRGELEAGIAALREALAEARALGDRYVEGSLLSQQLVLLNWADRGSEVDALVGSTLTALRESGNRPVLMTALANATISAVERVDLDQAEAYVGEAEGLSRKVGSLLASASVDRARGYLEQKRGNEDLARQRYRSALEKARQTDAWLAVGSYLSDLAWFELSTDHAEAAGKWSKEGMAAFERAGDPRLALETEQVLAWSEARLGDGAAARRRLAELRRKLEARGGGAGEYSLLTVEARVAEALREWPRAIALRRRTLQMAAGWKAPGLMIDQRLGLARALAGAGERRELEALARSLLPELDRLGLHGPAKDVRNLLAGTESNG